MRAEVLGELGEVYEQWNRHTEAIGAYEEATELIEAAHGRTDPRFGIAADRLADAHAHVGNRKMAVALYKELVQLMLDGPMGTTHPGLRVTLGKLGTEALAAGDAQAAAKAYGRLLELARGDDTAPAAGARADAHLQLARALSMPGKRDAATPKAFRTRLERALSHAHKAAEGFTRLPDGDPMDVAYSTNGVAGVLEKLGRDDEAVSAMERAYALTVDAKGSEADPAAVRAKKNLDGLRSLAMRKLARAKNVKSEL
eukprot:4158269-Prymnesium_polylepis.1